MDEARMWQLPLSAAAAQVWALEELTGQHAERGRQSAQRWPALLRAWAARLPAVLPRVARPWLARPMQPALAEQSRRASRNED